MAKKKTTKKTTKKVNNSTERRNIIVIWIIIIIALLLLAFVAFSFTGNYLTNAPRSCSDSDGGRDFYVKGVATNEKGQKFTDYCFSRNNLKEYYCQGNNVISKKHYCEGNCIEGICEKLELK